MNLSESELELLDGMVGMNLVKSSLSATSSEIGLALDVRDLDHFSRCLKHLRDEDLVRQRFPESISDSMKYYVNLPQFERLLKQLDPDGEPLSEPFTDWLSIKNGMTKISEILETADLSQSERAQAGAIISCVNVLLETPDPSKRSIRALLQDLAAVATIFALALSIAEMIK